MQQWEHNYGSTKKKPAWRQLVTRKAALKLHNNYDKTHQTMHLKFNTRR